LAHHPRRFAAPGTGLGGEIESYPDKKLDAAREVLIDAIYLHQQYDSPRCWRTEEEAFANFEGLKWKKDKMVAVKEQI